MHLLAKILSDVTNSDVWSILARLAGVLAAVVIVRVLVHHTIDGIAERIAQGLPPLARRGLRRLSTPVGRRAVSPLVSERREQRARTIGSVLKSATTFVVGGTGLVTALQLVGVPVAPLLASVSVVGVAVGLGAQSLIKDVVSGVFMLAEDQYGVGDAVELSISNGPAAGVVEAVGLRVTQLRGDDGTAWYLRNGEILRVGNHSQGWGRAVVDVRIAVDADLDAAEAVLLAAAAAVREEPGLAGAVLGEPELRGVEMFSAEGLTLRVALKTTPDRRADVARALRRTIRDRFGREGVPLAPIVMAGPTVL